MVPGESPRIFDHSKQYAYTEIFRLEVLSQLVQDLEGEDNSELQYLRDGWKARAEELVGIIQEAAETINEFLKNLEEQEKRT